MLSQQIQDFIRMAETNEGFDLKNIAADTLLEVETQRDTFHILVASPEKGEVVLVSPTSSITALKEPRVFFHQGSTAGGSMVKIGWVGVGLRLRMNAESGGLLTTTPVKRFTAIEDAELKKKLREAYEDYARREVISPEEFDRIIGEFVAQKFPSAKQAEVLAFLGEFCPEGERRMLTILYSALEAGKLDQALEILREDLKEHWSRFPKPMRGMFITEKDPWYIEEAYRKLGLPLPVSLPD